MTSNEQQMYKDISELTKSINRLVKLLEKIIKQQHEQKFKTTY